MHAFKKAEREKEFSFQLKHTSKNNIMNKHEHIKQRIRHTERASEKKKNRNLIKFTDAYNYYITHSNTVTVNIIKNFFSFLFSVS